MLSLIVAVVAATAQPAAKPVDPAAMVAATALVQQLDVRGQVQRGMDQNIQLMKSGVAIRSMLAQQPGFIPAYQANKARFDPALQKAGAIQAEVATKVVRDNIGAVVNEAARAYARNFSAVELTQIAAFYRSSAGLALLQRQPRVAAEIGQATGRIIGAKIDAGMKVAEPRIQAALAPLNAPPSAPKKK
nr:DUF2059 domain-containing protein [Polymorphobacter sp.]